ncbi:MAG TPA: NAD-dependent epimerase/dehydratase family protein, partial [Dongiaceae bacterium]
RLSALPGLEAAAQRLGCRLIDVRTPPPGIPVGTGKKRSGKRLLTVGTDCAVGKKYTALALSRLFADRNVEATFRATGQTGIMIAGGGMPMDAVVSDFAAGAAELLSPDAPAGHWDVIEGQGSLMHPAYAGVSLALLHGSQPDVVVVCHEPARREVLGAPGYPVPGIAEVMDLTLRLGARVNPGIRCGGIALNTSGMDARAAERFTAQIGREFGLPVADPMRGGAPFGRLADACLG